IVLGEGLAINFPTYDSAAGTTNRYLFYQHKLHCFNHIQTSVYYRSRYQGPQKTKFEAARNRASNLPDPCPSTNQNSIMSSYLSDKFSLVISKDCNSS
ncbi:hypothetical protein BB560_005303, partial [Smittium megazygosporum]